jgi:hypothetical protein
MTWTYFDNEWLDRLAVLVPNQQVDVLCEIEKAKEERELMLQHCELWGDR